MPIGRLIRKIQCQLRDVDQPAAEDRAADRAEQHRDAEDGHQPADPVRAGGPGHDRHAERHQHAAAEALQHAEADQLLDRVGGGAQHRADGEQTAPSCRAAWCRTGRRPSRSAGSPWPAPACTPSWSRRPWRSVASNSVWNVGSATLTTVMSRIDMIAPSTTTPAILSTAPSSLSGYSTSGGRVGLVIGSSPVSACGRSSRSVSGSRGAARYRGGSTCGIDRAAPLLTTRRAAPGSVNRLATHRTAESQPQHDDEGPAEHPAGPVVAVSVRQCIMIGGVAPPSSSSRCDSSRLRGRNATGISVTSSTPNATQYDVANASARSWKPCCSDRAGHPQRLDELRALLGVRAGRELRGREAPVDTGELLRAGDDRRRSSWRWSGRPRSSRCRRRWRPAASR